MDDKPSIPFSAIQAARQQQGTAEHVYLALFPAAERIANAVKCLEGDKWFMRASEQERHHVYGLLEATYDSPAWAHMRPEDIAGSVCKSLKQSENGTVRIKPENLLSLTKEQLLAPHRSVIEAAEKAAQKTAEKAKSFASHGKRGFSSLATEHKIGIGITAIFAGLAFADGLHRVWKHGTKTDDEGKSHLQFGQIAFALVNASIGAGLAYMAHSHYQQASGAISR